MKRRVNTKFLVILTVIVVGLGVAAVVGKRLMHEKPEKQQMAILVRPLACPFPRDSRGTTNNGGQNLTDHTPALLPAHAALRSASLHGGVGHSAVSLACHKRGQRRSTGVTPDLTEVGRRSRPG